LQLDLLRINDYNTLPLSNTFALYFQGYCSDAPIINDFNGFLAVTAIKPTMSDVTKQSPITYQGSVENGLALSSLQYQEHTQVSDYKFYFYVSGILIKANNMLIIYYFLIAKISFQVGDSAFRFLKCNRFIS